MTWAPKLLTPIFRLLLSLCVGFLLGRLPEARAAQDLGILTPFYRSTQLQGHLIGLQLMEIPDYLTAPDIDLGYIKKPGSREEVPFADSFSINRFLGGYREDWVKMSHRWDDRLGIRSLDYVTRQGDGSLLFRPELIQLRLEPYLRAGYRPDDITIALENVPWDLATKDGRAAEMLPWGRGSPPGDLQEWARVITQFALDLKKYLGSAVSGVRFKTGVEYDEKASFNGTESDFFRYYETTDRALHSVLPGAILTPGEFTGLGVCAAAAPKCVYDTKDFLAFAARERLNIPYVPRSLNSFVNKPAGVWPSAAAERANNSYIRLGPVVREIHQFGLLDTPVPNSDVGALQANWEFQTLVRLWAAAKPQRLFHWIPIRNVGHMGFLNGTGFLRLVLDRYLGAHAYQLDTQDQGIRSAIKAEVMALGLAGSKSSGVIVSSFSPYGSNTEARRVVATLPPTLLPAGRPLKTIRYRRSDNVYVLIRRDLAAEDNLKPEFVACPVCVAFPTAMAKDAERARAMLSRNWQQYAAAMKKNLRWVQNDPGVSSDGRTLSVTLEANELAVIE